METTLTSVSIDLFLNSLSANGHSPNTIRAYRADLNGLATWMTSQEPANLETMTANYLNAHRTTWSPKTTKRKLGTYRTWAKWAGIAGFLADYRAPTPARPTPHPIPAGIPAVVAMIEACGDKPRRKALVALCGLCGLRVSEARAIRPRDIDVVNRTLIVRGKGDRARAVPISDAAWVHLRPALELVATTEGLHAPLVGLNDRWARELLTRLAARAGIEHRVASHDLRSTLATAAYAATNDLRAVQELLGHASSTTTEVYTGVSSAAMRRAVNLDVA